MGFLSVKPAKLELQFTQLNHFSAQLQQRKQELQGNQRYLATVQHDLAKTLSDHAAAYNQLAPMVGNPGSRVGLSRVVWDTLDRTNKPDSLETQVERHRAYENTSQTIDLLISKIDSQTALISLMKNQIVKPRLFRGKSTAQLMSGIRQQVLVLESEVTQEIRNTGPSTKALIDENFDLQSQCDRMQSLLNSIEKLRNRNEPLGRRRGVGLGRW